LLLAFLLVCAGIVLGWTLFGSRSPEHLAAEDATSAERTCASAHRELRALPDPAPATRDALVARVEAETAVLTDMVAELDARRASGDTAATAYRAWIEDWNALLDARERYARELAREDRVELILPSERGIKPITERMDDFVREQGGRMEHCLVERLQAENVDRERDYGEE
jgi:hypothetical protein